MCKLSGAATRDNSEGVWQARLPVPGVRTCISGVVRVCPPPARNVLPGAALPRRAGPMQHQPIQGSVAEVLSHSDGDGCTRAPVLPEGGHVGCEGASHGRQAEAAGDGPHLQQAQGLQAQAWMRWL